MKTSIALGLIVGALAFGCSSEPTGTRPVPSLPVQLQCRCTIHTISFLEVEIVDDPIPIHREYTGVRPVLRSDGLEFHVTTLRSMYVHRGDAGVLQPFPTSFTAHVYLMQSNGDVPYRGPPPVRGLRALAGVGLDPYDHGVYEVGLFEIDAVTNTIVDGFYQFPAGTSIDQVLDPSEWGNPARGCNNCGI